MMKQTFRFQRVTNGGWWLLILVLFIFSSSCSKNEDNALSPNTQHSGSFKADPCDTIPVYPGGDSLLLVYLGNNINYPEDAITNEIEGDVYVKFTIGTDGSVSNVSVVKSLYGSCDDKVEDAIKAMPDWTPAYYQGDPINYQLCIPIRFELE